VTHTASDINLTGIVTGIQRFSIHDGPGIRSVVFLKGCPLSCAWCHNPETQSFSPEILYDASKCIGCGKCVPVCPFSCHSLSDGMHAYSRDKCNACGECFKVCPSALELCGKAMTVPQVLEEVLADRSFYNNDGGMTISGGEPFAQGEFALSLLKNAKLQGLNCAAETCGAVSGEILLRAVEYTDLFLYDIKETDPARHEKYTGADNTLILENLSLLSAAGANIILRIPVIPGVNDRAEHFKAVGELAEKYTGVRSVDVLPYHRAGNSKYLRIGREVTEFTVPDRNTSETYVAAIAANTTKKVKLA